MSHLFVDKISLTGNISLRLWNFTFTIRWILILTSVFLLYIVLPKLFTIFKSDPSVFFVIDVLYILFRWPQIVRIIQSLMSTNPLNIFIINEKERFTVIVCVSLQLKSRNQSIWCFLLEHFTLKNCASAINLKFIFLTKI